MPRTQTNMPVRKVTIGALAGAMSVMIIWVLKTNGTEVPGEVASAFTTILTFVVGYVVPPSEFDQVVVAAT